MIHPDTKAELQTTFLCDGERIILSHAQLTAQKEGKDKNYFFHD